MGLFKALFGEPVKENKMPFMIEDQDGIKKKLNQKFGLAIHFKMWDEFNRNDIEDNENEKIICVENSFPLNGVIGTVILTDSRLIFTDGSKGNTKVVKYSDIKRKNNKFDVIIFGNTITINLISGSRTFQTSDWQGDELTAKNLLDTVNRLIPYLSV